MATPALKRAALPGQPELQAFAAAAAQLLMERQPRAPGARAVSRRAGVGLQHLDHRDYAPGDEVRHIDWRQTARQRHPVIRRFETESTTDWMLLLDASSSMAGTKWQAALNAAAAMGYALLQMGHRVGLLAFGARVLAQCPPGRGQHHYAAMARLLDTLQPAPMGEGSALGACARHLHGAASVFVVSDFMAEGEMCAELGALLQRCAALHALQLDADADTQLALAGEFELVDVESGARLQVLLGAPACAGARAEREAMTLRLQRWCARSGVACTSWRVAQPWQHALVQHLVRARSLC